MTMEHAHEEHQRLSKIEAETKMAEMSAEMKKQAQLSADQESDLKIMASHLQYVQQVSLMNIMQHIDNQNLTVADIKKEVKGTFDSLEKETEQILHDHLVVVEGANAKSNAEMDRIEREVAAMTEREQEYDAELAKEEQKNAAAAEDEGPTDNKVIEARINSIFTHAAAAEDEGPTDNKVIEA